MTIETLQGARKDTEKFIIEILKKLSPEAKQRVLDIITGFSLAEDFDKPA